MKKYMSQTDCYVVIIDELTELKVTRDFRELYGQLSQERKKNPDNFILADL